MAGVLCPLTDFCAFLYISNERRKDTWLKKLSH